MNTIFWYRKLIPAFICLIFFGLFLILNNWFYKSGFWLQFNDWSPAYSFVCEYQNMNSVMRQPLNTLSNIIYLFFGIEIVIFSIHDRIFYKNSPNMVRMNYQYSLVFGLCLIYLFLGSSLYHASMLDFFSQFDMIGVYACILFPLIVIIHKIIAATYFGNKPYFSYWGSLIAIIIFIFSLFIFAGFFWQSEAYIFIPLMALILTALSVYHVYYYVSAYRKDFLIYSLVLILGASGCYIIDMYYCYELSYFQLHSIWHILAALSLYYYYLYLRSEKNLIAKTSSGDDPAE